MLDAIFLRRSSGRFAAIEPLEGRRLLSDVRFAVIGDFSAGQGAQDVAALVNRLHPDFVLTVGDNNYPDGSAATIDSNVGQYYHSFIAPYKGSYGAGSADGQNHFWPSLGDHDWDSSAAAPYLSYFSLPGNGRYYDLQRGNVGVFVLDSDPREPDGITPDSVQGRWLQTELAHSTAQWKFVICPFAPYSSGSIGDDAVMQWPFKQWGATAVFSGHDHDYERLNVGGLPYFVDGLGGQSTIGFDSPVQGSQARFAGDFGAMLVDAGDGSVHAQFITRAGQVVDDTTFGIPIAPAAPAALVAQPISPSEAGLLWQDPATDETGFDIQRSSDGVNFSSVATVPVGLVSYVDQGLSPGTTYRYRVRAVSGSVESAGFAAASATTLAAPSGISYLSDMNWLSASNDFGPVKLDRSNGGPNPGDGHTLTLNGVPYIKGLGVHANSDVVYDLGGAYSRFLADVGVDDEESIHGEADCQVLADGRLIFDSGVLSFDSATVKVSLDVSGVQRLSLVVRPGAGTIDYDHADWAGARVATAAAIPLAPPAPAIASAGDTQVALAWSDNSAGANAFAVQRSVDGVSYVTIAKLPPATLTYRDDTVSPRRTYWYRLLASNLAGDSAPSTAIRIDTLPVGFAFGHGLIGLRAITLGAGATIDSYDSSKGAYVARAAQDGAWVMSAGRLRLSRGAIIHGNAAGAGVIAGTVTGQRGRPAEPMNYPPLSPAGPDNTAVSRYLKRGDLRLGPVRTLTLPGGVYLFHNLALARSATLTFSGPAVVYVSGSAALGDGATLAAAQPAGLRLVLVGAGSLSAGPAASITADIYAPLSRISLGAGDMLFGSVVGNALTLGPRAAIHFDQALGSGKFQITVVPAAPARGGIRRRPARR